MSIMNRFALLLPLWFLFLFGCGGSKGVVARVSGSVKYKGSPVTAGTITFTAKGQGDNPEGGGMYLAPINSDGTYSLAQLPAGEFAVTIETESANPNRKKQQYGGPKAKQSMSPRPDYAASSQASQGAYVKIPSKYADPKTSGLAVKLTSGKNIQDFDLTD